MRRTGIFRTETDDFDDSIVLATFETSALAESPQGALRRAGIEARIVDAARAAPGDELAARLGPGVHVLVRREDLPPARQVLRLPEETDGDDAGEEAPAGSTPDEYAAAAYRLAFFSCAFPPLLVVTLAFFTRALRAGRAGPVLNRRIYRRHLVRAFVMGVLLPAGLIVALVVLSSPAWER